MAKSQTIVECPHCKKKVNWANSKWRPFCSERCRLIDLGDWASEKFKIAGEKVSSEPEPEDQTPESPQTVGGRKNKKAE